MPPGPGFEAPLSPARTPAIPGAGRPPGRTTPAWPGGAGRRWLLFLAGASGVAGAVLYDAFVVAGPLGSRLSAINAFVSELAVAGQPAAGFFRATDAATGALTLLLVAGLVSHLPKRPGLLAGLGFLAVFAIGSITDAAYPMSCTPSTNAVCRRQVDALSLSAQLHHPHALSGSVEIIAIILAMILFSRAGAVRRWSKWLFGFTAMVTLLVVCLSTLMGLLGALGGHWVGLVERGQLVVTSAWIAALAGHLIRDAVRARPAPAD